MVQHLVVYAVGAALGCRAVEVDVLEPGASSGRTFAVSTDGGDVVAKLSWPGQSMRPIAANLGVLRGLGLPVPDVLATAVLDDGREVLIMSRLPGRDLHNAMPTMSAGQLSALAEQLVDIQTTVGRLPVLGDCGYVTIGEAGTRSWTDVVRHPNKSVYADPLPEDAAPLIVRMAEVLDAAADRLSAVTPVCFLDDLTTRNVLIHDGRLSGVVDLDVICQGDPRFHLGLTAAAVHFRGVPLGRHYLAELARFARWDADSLRFVDLYSARFLVSFLGAEHPQLPGPWRRRSADFAHEHLDRAGSYFGFSNSMQ